MLNSRCEVNSKFKSVRLLMKMKEIHSLFNGGKGKEMLSFLPIVCCQTYLHFQVAIRKQEIEDRLNSWIVFNEKNKELCAWLVQMENKVLQTADISIEEMIEKLQKVSRSTLMAAVTTTMEFSALTHRSRVA